MSQPRQWSREPITGWVLLGIAAVVGVPLAWELHRTIGLGAPRFWELLRDDRFFDLAMLDFFLTAGWAALVLVERTTRRDWRFWLSLGVFCAIPTVGIALFLILKRRGREGAEVPPRPVEE